MPFTFDLSLSKIIWKLLRLQTNHSQLSSKTLVVYHKMLKKVVIFLFFFTINGNIEQFTLGNNRFSATVYKEFGIISDDNFLISPFSAETILALAQSGAKNETAEEIRNSLHLPGSADEVQSTFKELFSFLKPNQYSLQIANKIYIKDKFTIKKKFKQIATGVYRASCANINFSHRTKAAKKINKWVAKQTNNKIKNLINSDQLNDETRAILINALYFKGEWKKPFKRLHTRKQNFYKNGGETISVNTMHKTDHYGYYENPELNAKFLEIQIKGDNAYMIIVVPNEREGLPKLEEQIEIVTQTPQFLREYVNVAIPKFKIETKIDFKPILKNLGVHKAFTDADFSGISGKKGEIYVSDIVQKSFISVDEKGIEAAGASAVFLYPKSLIEYYGEKKNFIADHPFIFYIKINDIIIFIGRVLAPLNS